MLTFTEWKRIGKRLKKILATQVTILEGILLMTAESARLAKEVQETKDSNATLIGKITELVQSNKDLAQQLRDNANDAVAITKAADDLDAGQAANAAFLAGLSTAPVPLTATYPDRATFDAAVSKYSGQRVTLDTADVKAGTEPSLDYFTHSADGHIDTTGPTD